MHTLIHDYWRLGYALAEPKVPGMRQFLFRKLFNPVSEMFRNSEQGVWYDPSDFSTMFQDAAGTTPVTAMEQPVGLILDKSRGLVLGPELVTNGDFSNGTTGWKDTNVTSSGGTVVVSDGAAVITRGTARAEYYQTVTTVIGKTYRFSGTVITKTGGASWWIGTTRNNASNLNLTSVSVGIQSGVFTATATTTYITMVADGTAGQTVTIDNISVRELPGNHAYQSTSASRPVLSALVNQYLNTATLATQSVTTQATTYTLRFEGAGSITLSGTATGTYTAGAHSVVCTAGTLTSTVTGTVTNADLRHTNSGINLPPYQRVNTSTDYDTAGFPMYLRFDGVDDWLVTPSIDFTGTDKMTVCAGVRKSVENHSGTILELSAAADANPGAFFLRASAGGLANYQWAVRSATTTTSPTIIIAAPDSSLLTLQSSLSGPITNTRRNSIEVTSVQAPAGGGAFGNYPLYIGRRGGTRLPFNGQLYGLVIRGALSNPADIAALESFMNRKAKAY